MAQRPLPKLNDETLRGLVLGTFGHARWTQDSPIVPDVWINYIKSAEAGARARLQNSRSSDVSLDLLITPWTGSSPGKIAHAIRSTLHGEDLASARVATSSSRVAAKLSFDALISWVIPMTGWWQSILRNDRNVVVSPVDVTDAEVNGGQRLEYLRFVALAGFIAALEQVGSREQLREIYNIANKIAQNPEDGHKPLALNTPAMRKAIEYLNAAFSEVAPRWAVGFADSSDRRIWLINVNRPASQTMFDARKTVKADAAQRVFDTAGKDIVFAVIDNGIDATHSGFLDRDNALVRQTLDAKSGFRLEDLELTSRVRATYDFSLLRDLLADAAISMDTARTSLQKRNRSTVEMDLEKPLRYLNERAGDGRGLDWSIAESLIRRSHDVTYTLPSEDHGTHVAGILGARFEGGDTEQPLIGVCEKISLYDLRVFDEKGAGDEFSILAALEFVGWLNRDRDNPVIHGVNMSLALRHDVDSFGCGRTPVCDACNQLVGSGVVVVAAAGNMGFDGASKQSLGNGYRTVSITDPGNAEDVITVGSTHRRDPHAYGVSYFSSRGPTGDGRRKPDLLAPGEKITSTIRGNQSKRLDGTSMAAPHVSGAAALLMARYPELIGQPRRIKKILMETATDLGRETAFQGAGLLDILRALQSV